MARLKADVPIGIVNPCFKREPDDITIRSDSRAAHLSDLCELGDNKSVEVNSNAVTLFLEIICVLEGEEWREMRDTGE